MRRLLLLLLLIVVILGAVASTWFLARSPLKEQVAELSTSLDKELQARADLEGELDSSRSSEASVEQEQQRLKRRLRRISWQLRSQKIETRGFQSLVAALAPPGSRVSRARLLDESSGLLVTEWATEDRGGALPLSGFDIWRIEGTTNSIPDGLDRIYSAVPDPRAEELEIGPPGRTSIEASLSSYISVAEVGDVTRDGMVDLAIQDSGSGSGGCGVARLLSHNGTGFRELFRREDCDHGISIRENRLVYQHSISSPKICKPPTAHGCGIKKMWMRWTGSSWETLRTKRKLF
jgi:hypothetical protein